MFTKLLQSLRERTTYGEPRYQECWEKLKNVTDDNLVQMKVSYHSECYKSATNKTDINRLKVRFERSPAPVITTPVRRHASEETLLTPQPKRLRSQTILFDKNKCIICQKDGGKLHKVAFSATGQKFLDIAKQLPDQTLFIRLNSVPDASDAVANDVQYHLTCWVLAQRDAHKKYTI